MRVDELKTILDGDFQDAMRSQMLMWGRGKVHKWPLSIPEHRVYFMVPFSKTVQTFGDDVLKAYTWLKDEGYTIDWVDGPTMSISKIFKRGEFSGKEN